MNYKILTAQYPSDLAYLVNKALAEGWTLFGGVSVAVQSDSCHITIFAQAMIWNPTPRYVEQ